MPVCRYCRNAMTQQQLLAHTPACEARFMAAPANPSPEAQAIAADRNYQSAARRHKLVMGRDVRVKGGTVRIYFNESSVKHIQDNSGLDVALASIIEITRRHRLSDIKTWQNKKIGHMIFSFVVRWDSTLQGLLVFHHDDCYTQDYNLRHKRGPGGDRGPGPSPSPASII
ncbi:MAG: hypothetical protein K6L81_15615 [Agarilytica sp.]